MKNKGGSGLIFLVVFLLLMFSLGSFLLIREKKESVSLIKSWGEFPIDFIENQGQADPRVSYYVKGAEKTLYFGPEGVTVSIHKVGKGSGLPVREASAAIQRWNVKLQFEGANEGIKPEGSEKTDAKISYFKGPKKDWKTGIRTYRSIAYRDLWPGVDLVYSGSVDLLKQDFVVRPGGDPGRILLAYLGAESIEIGNDGGMEIRTPLGGFRDERPVAYQVIDGKKVAVEASYDLERRGDRYEYRFRVGRYDPARELIIDPATVIYAGFIGGSGLDQGRGIAVDSSGNAYVTGNTDSTQATFPETVGPDLSYNGTTDDDAFVAKVNAAGTALVYAGFIGGSGTDIGNGIAVDSSGNAYVTGSTNSTAASFPDTVGPDLTQNGGTDAFVAKVKSDGSGLDYAGFIGGSGDNDSGRGIAVDSSGNAYVTGQTDSDETTFPDGDGFGAVASFNPTHNGLLEVFVAKVKSDGSGLDYAGFMGGGFGNDIGNGIAVDSSGNAYVTGQTASSDFFPITGGSFDTSHNGGTDAFVAKVNSGGTTVAYGGFIGGSGSDFGNGIAVDSSGNAYVTGQTDSTESTFPETGGPDLTQNGGIDAFVAKVNAAGSGLTYAGFVGGSGDDVGRGVAVDSSGNAYVAGRTVSTESTFPETGGPDLTQNGGTDAFVAKVNAAGTGLSYAGFLGGSGFDAGIGIAVDSSGNVYITGETSSTETTFPETAGSNFNQSGNVNAGGADDAFVAKVGIVAVCGDGAVEGSEACDDGNSVNTDACLNTCVAAACGDGIVRAGVEACDDGNSSNDDSCTTSCALTTCGNGTVQSGEQCDDGNTSNTDSCLNTCLNTSCGDSFVQSGEECDDGGTASGDGCSATCTNEGSAGCGDGILQSGEGCDDGNTTDGDECTASCQIVDPVTGAVCGDGSVEDPEECDDGNTASDDGCSSACVEEEGGGGGDGGGGCSLIRRSR